MDKFILKNGRLEEIGHDKSQGGWAAYPEFIFYYCDKQVARVSFTGSIANVQVGTTFDPWAYVSNDKSQYFARIHVLEDQLHGVNVIEMDNLQALYMEYSLNNKPKSVKTILTPSNFAEALNNEIKYAIDQAKEYQISKLWDNI